MLPYETERHAKTIFSKWLLAATKNAGSLPSDTDANLIAAAAVRMAQEFSRVAEKYADSGATAFLAISKSGICKSLTFEELVHEWQSHTLIYWRKEDRLRVLNRFRRYLYPRLASRPVEQIRTPELIPAFQAIEDAGFLPLAHLVLRETIRVFRFAIASGYALDNPALDVRAILYRRKPRRRTTILLPERIGELLRAIDGYHSVTTSGYMLRLLPLVFLRPGELRQAEWTEIDLKSSQWRIPARRMKARRPHIVPLSRQAEGLFRQVHRITGNGRYVFPSSRTADGVLSSTLCTRMLQSIGFGGEMTMSGFRSMAATLLSEQGWSADVIERQLSHLDPRPVRRAYNFAEYLIERKRMMQAWADYLDKLAGRPSSCRSRR